MKHLKLTLILSFCLILSFTGMGGKNEVKLPPVVPKPVKMKVLPGKFRINDQTAVIVGLKDPDVKHCALFFIDRLRQAGGPSLIAHPAMEGEKIENAILLTVSPTSGLPKEGYTLMVGKTGITIKGGSGAGLFYGVQTLFQLLPPEIAGDTAQLKDFRWEVPFVNILDYPRYPYRGMHLDVSRHFFPKEFIKRYIDLIAMYRMNTFHWHLTDDNGWRIEIKKYPKLTSIGAWRVDRENLPWTERPAQQPGEKATYGGFYTQDDIREIVQYAKERFVTTIPEIEMPAHSLEVLAAYPELSCTGGSFYVCPGSYWPNLDILCAGNDFTFQFMEDVLTEVMELFPSKYIHIGGDEADKTRWKYCPKCQARIKSEGLKDEKELQSYFIKRIEKFLMSKDRRLIGWDEILQGGLAPEVTVMSWRGIEGGIAAAKQGHDVIMTPGSHCYFDYYQGDPESEPKAIGGYTTLKKVYSFEPTPVELTADEGKFILGAQGNVWTEYISTPAHAEYMVVPRMIALAEVVWSPSALRNWDDFRDRMNSQFKRLDKMKVNYCKGSFKVDITTKYDTRNKVLKVTLSSEQPDFPIHYCTNGDDPKVTSPRYTEPVSINGNSYIKAGMFKDGKLQGKASERAVLFHKATGRKVTYYQTYSYRYPAGGDGALTDGLRGSTDHKDGTWQGFHGNDLDILIDLGKTDTIMSISAAFLQNVESWIWAPDTVIYSLSSDGKRFHSINEVINDTPKKTDRPLIKQFSQGFPMTPARYIRVRAKNPGICPPWHEGAGEKCWIFTDEIAVY